MELQEVILNEAKQYFRNQYSYFQEEWDPRFPDALLDELEISTFVDACNDKTSHEWGSTI